MTRAAYIAIDSGGSRTNMSLRVEADGIETMHRRREVNEALSGALDPHDFVHALRAIMSPLEALWGDLELGSAEDTPAYLFISAAGFAASSRDLFLNLLKEVLPSSLKGAIRVAGAANDAVTLMLSHERDAVTIAGTGSNILVRGQAGQIHQAGGHDWVAADDGAGFWIGLHAIRAVARALEAGNETVLFQRFCREYHVNTDDTSGIIATFRSLAIADHDMKAQIARFTTSVCDAARKGDEEAQNIVKAQAEDLARSLVRALRRWQAPEQIEDGLNILLCGSVLGNQFYRSAFQSAVELKLFSGPGDARIEWGQVEDGIEATYLLAKRLKDDPASLQSVTPQFLPVIIALSS